MTLRHPNCPGEGCPHCANYDADPEHFAPAWLAIGGKVAPRQCVHLGAPTGKTVVCPSCTGRVQLKLFACAVYGECTTGKPAPGLACCGGGCPGAIWEAPR